MSKKIDALVRVVDKLREPGGCPWDRKQTHRSLLPHLLDETYELFDAVDSKDYEGMKEELGDVLLQVVLHSRLGAEKKRFTLDDVAVSIAEKLVRRHPHVFGTTKVSGVDEVLSNWEEIKKAEKGKEKRRYVTDGIPRRLPALLRAEQVQRRVSRVGFDWTEVAGALDKVEEEFAEFREAVARGNVDDAEGELGDIIFALINVARHTEISAEAALHRTTEKFINRFRFIEESHLREGRKLADSTLEEKEKLWDESKRRERVAPKKKRLVTGKKKRPL